MSGGPCDTRGEEIQGGCGQNRSHCRNPTEDRQAARLHIIYRFHVSSNEDHADTNDSPGSETPFDFDKDHWKALIHTDPPQSTQQLASMMNYEQFSIVYLHSMVKIKKISVWMPQV